jgi:cardiolipin synthase
MSQDAWLVSEGNRVEPLVDREEVLSNVLDTIQKAEHSVEVQSFLFGGTFGNKIAEALVERHKAGVDVRVMVDPKLKIVGADDHLAALNYLKTNGIEVRTYPTEALDPKAGWLTHHRAIAHRKAVISDGKTAITGGMNLSDGGGRAHDFMVRMEGPSASQINNLFNRDWVVAGGKSYPDAPPAEAAGKTEVTISESSPTTHSIPSLVVSEFAKAQKSIVIEALFLTHPDYLQALIEAHDRGVDIKIIVDDTAATGNLPFKKVLDSLKLGAIPNIPGIEKLEAAGIPARLFVPHDGMTYLHGKLAVIDGKETLIGSANFTRPAAAHNSELMLKVDDVDTSQRFEQQFQDDWEHHTRKE